MSFRASLLVPVVVLLLSVMAHAGQPSAPQGVDIANPAAVLDLGASLVLRDASRTAYALVVRNGGATPVSRVLVAADAPAAALEILPPAERPVLVDGTSTDAGVVVQRLTGFAESAVRVSLPPMGAGVLNLRFNGLSVRPMLLAWQEAALVQHERQAAILSGVVSGLLASAFAFALGAAVLCGSLFGRWAAAFLGTILCAQLIATGVFDSSFLAAWSGPYPLFALAVACALAAGVRLIDRIAPYDAAHPGLGIWLDYGSLGILGIGIFAYVGVPVTGIFIRLVALSAAAGAASYLAQCGRAGNLGARRMAPAATIFALVTVAAACNALGLFGVNLVASEAIGGFAAAGALVVAVATAVPFDAAVKPAGAALVPAAALNDREQQREIAAVTASHQGVFDLDMHSGLVSLSAEGAQLFGLPSGAVELAPETWLDRIHPDDREVFRDALRAYRNDPGIAFRLEFRARGPAGRMAWFELRATMTGQATEAERCLGLIANVTARKNAEATEAQSGPVDPLTGLGTRAALLARLDTMRGKLKVAALAVFDLDRFKSVNDSLGRDGGDALLIAFADRLVEGLIEEDPERMMLCRVGGDMFAAGTQNIADLHGFGERIVDLLSPPFTIQGRDIYLPSSVGVAAGEFAEDAQDLLAQAELAMVEAKREGGGRVVVYSSTLSQAAPRDSVAIETDLRRALEKNEIEVHYQPIIRLKDGAMAGFEALVRWRHPERGLIEPDDFVPQAERSGLIVPLGKFALTRACEDLARWQNAFPSKPALFVSVNVAWRQIADKNFGKDLIALLRSSSVVKRSLKLEVTEGQMTTAPDRAEEALKKLKTVGVGLSIDDFGTGHSSLSRLARFPFDTIKIDKSFLAASVEPGGAKILAAMVSLAHGLKLAVVCEGVEKPEEAARLKEMGCEFGQGYLMGMPVPASEIDAVIGKATVR